MRGRATTVVLPALVVVVLVALVAIASTGSTPGGSNATRSPSETLYDTFFTLGLVAVVAGGILLGYGLMQRRAIAHEVATGKYRRTSLLAWLAFVAVFTAFTSWRMTEWEFTAEPPEEGDLVFTGDSVVPTLPDTAETSYEPSVAWIPIGVVMGLVAAGVIAWVVSERRARGTSADRTLAEELALVLDDTLDDLRAEADPRRAVIAAYARLEAVLAANGVPRLASETPDEYLPRVLRTLETDPAAVTRLTALYTRAKFSQHEVDATMKDEAIEALEHVRDALRRAPESPSLADESAPPAFEATS